MSPELKTTEERGKIYDNLPADSAVWHEKGSPSPMRGKTKWEVKMSTTAIEPKGYCPHCSNPPSNYVYHSGKCPKVKSVEYYPNGTVKKVELRD